MFSFYEGYTTGRQQLAQEILEIIGGSFSLGMLTTASIRELCTYELKESSDENERPDENTDGNGAESESWCFYGDPRCDCAIPRLPEAGETL